LWLPQAQFAGYFVAYEKGFYKEQGLDVTLINGSPDLPPAESLAKGKTDFAMMFLFKAIEQRANGIRLVNIAQTSQRSALMLVAKKSSNILKPEDLNHRKVGVWRSEYKILPQAFFNKYGLDVEIFPITSSINLFLWDGIDAINAMWYNEYHVVLNSGYNPDELTTFFFFDHGLNFPEDGLYTLEETYARDPETCRAFARASIEGWWYACENPDTTIQIVMSYMKKAHVPANLAHQTWMLNRMRDVILPAQGSTEMGILRREAYDLVAKNLIECGVIKAVPDFDAFYKGPGSHAEK
jgi:NitT/TauT family transport system substrate-binding protein